MSYLDKQDKPKANEGLLMSRSELKVAETKLRYIPAIASSLSGIIGQSHNKAFKKECLRMLGANTEDEAHEQLSRLLALMILGEREEEVRARASTPCPERVALLFDVTLDLISRRK